MKHDMRHFGLSFIALFLAAYSMNELADKILPETVKTQSHAAVDAVMNNQPQYFSTMKDFLPGMDQVDFDAAVNLALETRSSGEEMSRNVIGANANVSTTLGEGESKTYEVVYEVKTDEGYTLVSLRYVLDPKTQDCCRLNYLNVQKFETSPHHESYVQMAKALKTAVPIGLLIIFGLIGFFVWRRRKQKLTA